MDRELVWRFVNAVLVTSTVIGLLYPAFVDNRTTFTQIFVSLWEPDWSITFVYRWLVLPAFLAAVYAIVLGMIYRKIPITLLSGRVELKYLDKDGRTVEVSREQVLRAHQRNVTAYYTSHKAVAPHGRVPRAEISMNMYWIGGDLKDSYELAGTDSDVEVIHSFAGPLPYGWLMPLVPIWVIKNDYHKIPKIFRKYLVKRTSKAVYEEEYNNDRRATFLSGPYSVHNQSIALDFSLSQMPPPGATLGLRIKNHGVIKL